MSDLISREAALNAIKSYCDGCDNYNGVRCSSCYIDSAIIAVDAVPAVDAVEVVEVVRCKDCVNMGKLPPIPTSRARRRKGLGWCIPLHFTVLPNDFCSAGKRRTNNDKD